MTHPNFTIIIPHKNTPGLLQKCLDSIPPREDIQTIVVDDNSDSDVVDFNNFPGLCRKNTEVYLTKEGKGAGYARNVGLAHARGKWVSFIDADDFFTDVFSSILDDCVLLDDVDILFFKTQGQFIDGSPSLRGSSINDCIDVALSQGDFRPLLLNTVPWARLFRFDKISNLKFNEVRWGNDVVFMARATAVTHKYLAIDRVGHCVVDRDGSLRKSQSLESLECRLLQDIESVDYYQQVLIIPPLFKFYYYKTWEHVYLVNRRVAMRYFKQMISLFGLSFLKSFLHQSYKRRKRWLTEKIVSR